MADDKQERRRVWHAIPWVERKTTSPACADGRHGDCWRDVSTCACGCHERQPRWNERAWAHVAEGVDGDVAEPLDLEDLPE